jgi:phosphohistidine phosphatase SixA
MRLYIVRHGKAEPAEEFPGPDRDRPLKKRGERQATWLAEFLTTEVSPEDRPAWIATSGFKRAIETARIIQGILDVPLREAKVLEFGHGPADVVDFIRSHAARHSEEGGLMIVGHNPQLEEVLALLTHAAGGARGAQRELRTGEAAELDFAADGEATLRRKLRLEDED